MNYLLTAVFLLLAPQQVFATYLCCGTGEQGPVDMKANWCEEGGGHILCCYQPMVRWGKRAECLEQFSAQRQSVPGKVVAPKNGNYCVRYGDGGGGGMKYCVKDGSSW
ncbi:hypothetical protein ACJBU6_06482 [Exserohilum turcicum]